MCDHAPLVVGFETTRLSGLLPGQAFKSEDGVGGCELPDVVDLNDRRRFCVVSLTSLNQEVRRPGAGR